MSIVREEESRPVGVIMLKTEEWFVWILLQVLFAAGSFIRGIQLANSTIHVVHLRREHEVGG